MSTNWSVPIRMWEGKTVAVLASGPSMSAEVANRVRAALIPTIVTNDTFRLAPWADMLYAADTEWWSVNAEDALQFAGLKVTASDHCDHDVLRLRQTGYVGYDPDPRCVRTGGNSGYQAVHVALRAGASRVLLCGFDMHGTHWFGEHKKPLQNAFPSTLEIRAQEFIQLKVATKAEIINCTPGSAIKCFRFADLDEALRE